MQPAGSDGRAGHCWTRDHRRSPGCGPGNRHRRNRWTKPLHCHCTARSASVSQTHLPPFQVITPYGGGGLTGGVASAVKLLKPAASCFAAELETGAPLALSLAAGRIVDITPVHAPAWAEGCRPLLLRRPRCCHGWLPPRGPQPPCLFVDPARLPCGRFSGSPSVIESVWPVMQANLTGSATMSVVELARAVKLLAERCHLITEGAGAAAVAVALANRTGAMPGQKVVCVISGGHIDTASLGPPPASLHQWADLAIADSVADSFDSFDSWAAQSRSWAGWRSGIRTMCRWRRRCSHAQSQALRRRGFEARL